MNTFKCKTPNREVVAQIIARYAFRDDIFEVRDDDLLIIKTHKTYEELENRLHEMVDTKLIRRTLIEFDDTPKVVVKLRQGLPDFVHCSVPMNVIAVEHDPGSHDEDVFVVRGEEVYTHNPEVTTDVDILAEYFDAYENNAAV